MVWIDYTIIGVVAFSSLVSLVRGFTREAFSLVIWIAAFFIAGHFYGDVSAYFTQIQDTLLRSGVAIGVLFLATLVVGAIVSYVLGTLVDKTGLSGIDRVLGIFFGALRGVLIVAAVLFFVDAFTPIGKSEVWQQSELIPYFRHIIEWFFSYFKDTSSLL